MFNNKKTYMKEDSDGKGGIIFELLFTGSSMRLPSRKFLS